MRSVWVLAVLGIVLAAANGCDGDAHVAESLPPASSAPVVIPARLAPTATPAPAPAEPPATPEPFGDPEPSVDPDPDGVLPAAVVEAIPDGHILLARTTGDLDGDGDDSDLAVVVRLPGDADFGPAPDTQPPRPVMLFLSDGADYTLAARSDEAALCGRCGGTFGDPFSDIRIDGGTVSIGHYGGSAWRWTHTPTFAYDAQADDWLLVGIGGSSFHTGDPDETLEDTSVTDVDPVPFADYESDW